MGSNRRSLPPKRRTGSPGRVVRVRDDEVAASGILPSVRTTVFHTIRCGAATLHSRGYAGSRFPGSNARAGTGVPVRRPVPISAAGRRPWRRTRRPPPGPRRREWSRPSLSATLATTSPSHGSSCQARGLARQCSISSSGSAGTPRSRERVEGHPPAAEALPSGSVVGRTRWRADRRREGGSGPDECAEAVAEAQPVRSAGHAFDGEVPRMVPVVMVGTQAEQPPSPPSSRNRTPVRLRTQA